MLPPISSTQPVLIISSHCRHIHGVLQVGRLEPISCPLFFPPATRSLARHAEPAPRTSSNNSVRSRCRPGHSRVRFLHPKLCQPQELHVSCRYPLSAPPPPPPPPHNHFHTIQPEIRFISQLIHVRNEFPSRYSLRVNPRPWQARDCICVV